MGSPNAIIGPELEETPHQVKITRDYYLGVYEVTQRQFQLVMGRNPSEFQGAIVDHLNDDLPVDDVSWQDAVEFCDKLSGFEEEKQSRRAYRLPTEAEWEYACRAGTTSVYSFGDEAGLLWEYAWFSKSGNNRTHTVGLKEPSAWGLYDMHGNVWEWCWDWDSEYPIESVIDPKGPDSGDVHVLRGGGWDDDPYRCRSAGCRGNPSKVRRNLRGFRIAIGFPIPFKNQPVFDAGQTTMESSQNTLLTNSIGMKLVLIPKGTFMMGSPESEEARFGDETQHEVTISKDYYLGVYEVTQAQYEKVMGANPSYFQGEEIEGSSSNHPVE
ncbi:MAG: formylglycine-generating enzyme family protein, partial [Pirellula sp.]